MEASINMDKNGIASGVLKKILLILSAYPWLVIAFFLAGGLFQSHTVAYLGLFLMACYMFLGWIAWIVVVSVLWGKNRISAKHVWYNALVLLTGIYVTYLVIEYDVFASGAKYMD